MKTGVAALHFAGQVVAKEQLVLLNELRAEPLFVIAASRLLACFFANPTRSFCLRASICRFEHQVGTLGCLDAGQYHLVAGADGIVDFVALA